MSDIKRIESIIADLTERVQKFHNGDWVSIYCSGYMHGWRVANGVGGIRIHGENPWY